MDYHVKHTYPDGKVIMRYIPADMYDVCYGYLPKGHKYEIVDDLPEIQYIKDKSLEDVLNEMDDAALRFYASEKGVKLMNTKDREKIIARILQAAKL